MRLRRLAGAVLILVLMGCAKAPKPAPPPEPAPPVGPPPAPIGVAAGSLFPAAAAQYLYRVIEGGADETVTERLVRQEGRIDGFYDGTHYLTWHLNDEGVWREDPGGSKVLLRYLPPVLEEMQWQQRAGEQQVWFRLSYAPHRCMARGSACWQLEVLREAQRTIFEFYEGTGPVQVLHHDHGTGEWFAKYQVMEEAAPAGRPDLKPLPELQRSPVEAVTQAAYQEQVERLMAAGPEKLERMALDLDGDGRPEIVRGAPSGWMKGPAYIETADGRIIEYLLALADAHRVSAVTVPGYPHPFFAHERATENRPMTLSINHVRAGTTLGYLTGWTQGHSQWVEADLWQISEDGQTLVAQRDLRDPAGHTQVVAYKLHLQEPLKRVERTAITYQPSGAALRYPNTPQGVLHAAFAAQWHGLADELPSYFAATETAAVLAQEAILKQPYHLNSAGAVRFGTLGPAQTCGPKLTEAAVKPGGENTYLATWSQFGSCWAVWGKVTFGTDSQGRPVIRTLTIEGSHAGSYL